jgi:hypothetical protein
LTSLSRCTCPAQSGRPRSGTAPPHTGSCASAAGHTNTTSIDCQQGIEPRQKMTQNHSQVEHSTRMHAVSRCNMLCLDTHNGSCASAAGHTHQPNTPSLTSAWQQSQGTMSYGTATK